ncbi:MAG TPA: alkaline phosphatase family protein [Chloroflexia bacterium]|nr:alkaline phosphatase family protein [Chloroflexia bacterium]
MRNLFVILDGVGYDQVTRFRPAGLLERGARTGLEPLTTLLAYSSGIYPSIWSGQYPDQHGIWTDFYRHPRPRPALTGPLGVLPGKYLPRQVAYVLLAALARLGVTRREYHGVPPHVQRQFGSTPSRYRELPPVPMPDSRLVSEVMAEQGVSWEYIFCDRLDEAAATRIRTAAARVDTVIVCFPELDEAGHHLGPMTDAFGAVFRAFDARLAGLLLELERAWPGAPFFFFSDHGMTPVTQQFDVWSYLETRGFRLGADYLGFINSTVMALWPTAKRQVALLDSLNKSGYGRVLRPAERTRYHLDFKTPKYGREFFVAHEGVEIIPNFISLSWKANQGMHGYDPACSSTRSFYIGGRQVRARPRDVVGLYEVLVEAVGVPTPALSPVLAPVL